MNEHQKVTQAVVTSQSSLNEHQKVERFALFRPDGAPQLSAIVTGTAIGTAAKTTTSPEPLANTIVPIRFTNGNSAASPTVAFNGGTARAIHLGGAAPAGAEITIAAGGVALFWFDGTVLYQLGVYS